MAVIYNKSTYDNIMTLPKSTGRSFGAPLDPSAVWKDWGALKTYAASDATAYVGQIVTFCGERPVNEAEPDGAKVNVTEAYMISSEAGTLIKLAATTTSGDLSGDVATLQGQVEGLISKVGVAATSDESATGIYALIDAVEAAAEAADSKGQSALDEIGTREGGVGTVYGDIVALETAVADRYTKSEVDGMLSGAFHFKGNKEYIDQLPTTGQVQGDVWVVKYDVEEGSFVADSTPVANIEYAWTGDKWEPLGGIEDLSAYATKAYADQAKADAISAAAADATSKANTAESNANQYTDQQLGSYATTTAMTSAIQSATTDLQSYADQAEADAISTAGTNADSKISTAIGALGEKSAGVGYANVKEYIDTKDSALSDRIGSVENSINGLGDLSVLDVVSETELSDALKQKIDGKADSATTLAGYGIADAMTSTAITSAIATAQNQAVADAGTNADSKISTALQGLTETDSAVDGKYVSAVSQSNGVISVTRADLPDYSSVYETKGAASAVLGSATDDSTKVTVYGAIAKAQSAQSAAESAASAASAAQSTANSKVASVSAGDSSVTIGGDTTTPTVAVKVDPASGNALTLSDAGLKVVVPESAEYSIAKLSTASEGAAASYQLTKDGTNIGAIIDIPKDMVVSSGTVETKTTSGTWGEAGTYLVLTLANASNDKVYINANSLIEYVTSGSGTNDSIQIEVSADHKVTATIKDGSISKAKLETALQTKIDGIESGANVNKIESVKVGDTALAITDKSVTIPVASATALGAVKSSTADNKISISNEGDMEVNSLDVMKLFQNSTDILILDGGASI